MRDIKFRVWDGDTQKWITDNPMWHHRVMEDLKWSDIFPIPKWKTYQAIKFQQYTGLKDKNDVEIYEGDILKISTGHKYKLVSNDEWHEKFRISEVVYNAPKFKIDGDSLFLASIDKYCEIIGNIYENPELLES